MAKWFSPPEKSEAAQEEVKSFGSGGLAEGSVDEWLRQRGFRCGPSQVSQWLAKPDEFGLELQLLTVTIRAFLRDEVRTRRRDQVTQQIEAARALLQRISDLVAE